MSKDVSTIGIVTKADNYGEYDKLLRILTPDLGLITVKAKSVRKEKAKLKAAAVPFAFFEYSLAESGAFYVLKTASQVESLIGVSYTPEKYLSASVVLEAASVAGADGEGNSFVYLLKTLKKIIYSDIDSFSFAINYIYYLLKNHGFVIANKTNIEYNIEVDRQEALGPSSVTRIKLRNLVIQFGNCFGTHIKSSELL
ncbi:MAG: DNA repair protein RecO [Clostridia bacterium]|nr:DNA repair protein RecO [Clostridia bacterium]